MPVCFKNCLPLFDWENIRTHYFDFSPAVNMLSENDALRQPLYFWSDRFIDFWCWLSNFNSGSWMEKRLNNNHCLLPFDVHGNWQAKRYVSILWCIALLTSQALEGIPPKSIIHMLGTWGLSAWTFVLPLVGWLANPRRSVHYCVLHSTCTTAANNLALLLSTKKVHLAQNHWF